MATDSSYLIPAGGTSENFNLRKRLALALAQKTMQSPQIDHWTQGLAHVADSALAGYEMAKINKEDREDTAKGNALLAQMLGGGAATAPSPAPAAVTASGPTPAEVSAATDANMPRGYRNMNPGNIEDGPFARSQPGYAGSDGRFAKFASLDNGTAAMGTLLDSYSKRGLNTPAAIIGRWAPSSDGNNVSAYAGAVAKELGIGPNDAIPPEKRQALIAAMARHENGAPLPQSAPQSPPVQVAQAGQPNRELLVQMLNNRKTAPIAQQIIGAQIGQQFKPSEYDFKERPDGTLVAVNKKNPSDARVVNAPGGGDAAIKFAADKAAAIKRSELEAARAVAKPEQDKQDRKVANIVTQDIDRALNTIKTSTLPTTGATGNVLSMVGGTAAHDLGKLLDTVKSNAGFQELSKMRQSSPTGAALGNVTERETALLQATIGNLEQSQSREQLEDNLRRVKNTYLDIIHGEGKGPARETLKFQEKPKAVVDPAAIEEARKRGLIK